jgi:hypothetical protein
MLGAWALPAQAQVAFGDDSSSWSFDGECDDPRFIGDGMANVLLEEDRLADATDCRLLFESGRIRLRADAGMSHGRGALSTIALTSGNAEYGRLERGDDVLDDGEYCDYFTFEGTAGALAVIVLRTDDFDPYLIVRSPSGEQVDNDDHEGDATRSVVTFPMQESGSYTVGVTSYRAQETGSYAVLVDIRTDTAAPGSSLRRGELEVRAVAPSLDEGPLLAGDPNYAFSSVPAR